MGNFVMMAPFGGNVEALFVGIREFPTKKVYLICKKGEEGKTQGVISDLDKFKIPAEVKTITGSLWEEMFRIVGEITSLEQDSDVIMNVSTGDSMSSCAALSASFVNGIKAMGVSDNKVMVLPVLKFSYYKILTERKMNILKKIENEEACCSSLEELSKMTKMSLPLVSYHVNGNLKSDGLKDLGLVATTEKSGRTAIALTTMGRLLVKGYL